MTRLKNTLPLLLALALATPALAQTAEETPAEETPNPMALSMGEEAVELGGIYRDSEHGDWEIRCIKTENEVDPCQLYQLLDDGQGNPVAEINVFPIGGENEAAAGATIITPLETLLTQQLGMSVDGGPVRKYPFSWCSQIGCFSRLGLSDADVNAFRRGNAARLIIVPVAAPDQTVALTVSLTGFTAGFAALEEMVP